LYDEIYFHYCFYMTNEAHGGRDEVRDQLDEAYEKAANVADVGSRGERHAEHLESMAVRLEQKVMNPSVPLEEVQREVQAFQEEVARVAHRVRSNATWH
jgi:hypothetical protein